MFSKSLVIIIFLVVAVISLPAAEEQYKKLARDMIADISDGKMNQAIMDANTTLERFPDDPEFYYVLATAYTQKNDIAQAVIYAQKALEQGLPASRFLAGPRTLLNPLIQSNTFKQLNLDHSPQIIHGPMLGNLTKSSAQIWIRTSAKMTVTGSIVEQSEIISSQNIETDSKTDFTGIFTFDNLQANTTYRYVLNANSKMFEGTFTTFPTKETSSAFTIGFGGGAGYTPQYERMWETIASHQLRSFLMLGDNVYIDHPTRPDVQRYCYYRRQSRPEFQTLTRNTPIYSIWDDHDFTDNDSWGGPDTFAPDWKLPVWRLYKNNWVNPGYGGGENQPGCWYSFSIGDVDFIMLDGRYYRTDPKVNHPSMLGPVQKRWLLDTLKNSTGTFKVLASPVPWAYGSKPGSLDPWQGYRDEREEIFSFIEENKIEGVILISADRHRSDAWRIERPNGYDLYEFESSRLSNIHTHKIMPGSLFGYNKTCSFGTLSFDTTLDDPAVTYTILTIDDEKIHQLMVKKSQLDFNE